MDITSNWVLIVNIVGAANGFFLSAVIAGIKKGKKITNLFLASLIFSLTLLIFYQVLWQTGFFKTFPYIIGYQKLILFLLGPLLFFYVKSLTDPKFIFKKIHILHFIPFFLNLAYQIPFFLKSSEYKIEFTENPANILNLNYVTVLIAKYIHLFIYIVVTMVLLKKHSKEIKSYHSSIEKITLSWMYWLLIAFSLFLWALITHFMLATYWNEFFMKTEKIFNIWETLIVFIIGYRGLIQPEIFSQTEFKDVTEKYKLSSLTQDQAEKYLEKLKIHMEKEKPHLYPNLTLYGLSKKISIQSRHLSQIINENLNQNFYDFINHYRMEEAKRYLEDTSNHKKNILEILLDSGFNSKSVFNRVFKKYTGMTPSEYRKTQQR